MQRPFIAINQVVPAEWIDLNGHMNATHYGLVAYEAHYRFTEALGLGEAYVNETQCGKAVLESHMVYEREVSLGDELVVYSWLLAVDHKRLHFFHEIYNQTQSVRAATAEQVDIHIDLKQRRSSPFPEIVAEKLQRVVKQTLALKIPFGVGSKIRPPQNHWL